MLIGLVILPSCYAVRTPRAARDVCEVVACDIFWRRCLGLRPTRRASEAIFIVSVNKLVVTQTMTSGKPNQINRDRTIVHSSITIISSSVRDPKRTNRTYSTKKRVAIS